MNAIKYDITHTKIPRCADNYHVGVSQGYAYETDTHFVHFFGSTDNWYGIHTGLTAIEEKKGNLNDWVIEHFGAINIETMNTQVGESVEGVWRPSLYFLTDCYQALGTSESERRLSEQGLRILLQKLDDLFLYIEPDSKYLETYSHKTRELLILACTEVENSWVQYLTLTNTSPQNGHAYTTKDYVKLKGKLFLEQYQCTLRSFSSISPFNVFANWDASSSTQSLTWYDSYNKTKHNRTLHFSEATFGNAIQAVIANIVMYIVRFSPYSMQGESGTFNSLINQHFKFMLISPNVKDFYLPLIKVPSHYRKDIFIYNSRDAKDIQPFSVKQLVL